MSCAEGRLGGLLRVLAYPFTGGAVALVLPTLVGMGHFPGVPAAILAGAFAIPIVRASARSTPEAHTMPRLLPPPPGLVGELGAGAGVFFVYLSPWFLAVTLVLLAQDVDLPQFVYAVMVLPVFFQIALLALLPAAVIVLATEGSFMFALSRARVLRTAGELGSPYGGLAALMLGGGLLVYLIANSLHNHGLVGRGLGSLLAAWFWLLLLHVVGRVLRKRRLFEHQADPDSEPT